MEKLDNCNIDGELIFNDISKSDDPKKDIDQSIDCQEEDKKFNLDELEEMISNGINPPGIEVIDDMPKENHESVIDFSSSKKLKKPWECNKNNEDS